MGSIENDRTGGTSRRSGNSPVFSFGDFCSYASQSGFFSSDSDISRELFETVGLQRLLPYMSFFADHQISDDQRSMESVASLVEFDSSIRNVVFKYVDVIETQLKARYAQFMLDELGEFCIMDKRNFKYEAEYRESLRIIKRELDRQKSVNAAIQRQADLDYNRVPIRLAVEVSSLGTVSKLLKNTRSSVVTNKVAESFGVNKQCLLSWVKTVSLVRNACAHFVPYVVRRQIPSVPKPVFDNEEDHTKPLYILVVIERLLRGRVDAGYEKAMQDLETFRSDIDNVLGVFACDNAELAEALHIPACHLARYHAKNSVSLLPCKRPMAAHYGLVCLAA